MSGHPTKSLSTAAPFVGARMRDVRPPSRTVPDFPAPPSRGSVAPPPISQVVAKATTLSPPRPRLRTLEIDDADILESISASG